MNKFYQSNLLILIILLNILVPQSLFSQKLYDSHDRFYCPLGLMQWAGEDSSYVVDYLLKLDWDRHVDEHNNNFIKGVVSWRIDLRSQGLFTNEVEFQISILGGWKDTVIVLAYPREGSIFEQEKKLKERFPNESNLERAKRIKMKYDTILVSGNQEIVNKLSELKKIKYPVMLIETELGTPWYQIYSRNSSGQVYIALSYSSEEGDKEIAKLLKWIDGIFPMIKKMSKNKE